MAWVLLLLAWTLSLWGTVPRTLLSATGLFSGLQLAVYLVFKSSESQAYATVSGLCGKSRLFCTLGKHYQMSYILSPFQHLVLIPKYKCWRVRRQETLLRAMKWLTNGRRQSCSKLDGSRQQIRWCEQIRMVRWGELQTLARVTACAPTSRPLGT